MAKKKVKVAVEEELVEEVEEEAKEKVEEEAPSDDVFRGVPYEELRNHPRLHEPFLSRFGEKEAAKWFD